MGERAITITITRTSFKMVAVLMGKPRVKNISSYFVTVMVEQCKIRLSIHERVSWVA